MNDKWHEKGELPPVGAKCEVFNGMEWERCKIIAKTREWVVFTTKKFDRPFIRTDSKGFRPFQSERDKLIEEANCVIERAASRGGIATSLRLAKEIVDAGWRPKSE